MHQWIDVRGKPHLLPKLNTTIVGAFNCTFTDPEYDVDCHSAIFEYEEKLATGLTHYFVLKRPRQNGCLKEL